MPLDPSGKPMMFDADIAMIDKLIEERKPEVCLEWGAGNSTVYFPKKHDCIKKWVSIEHNGHYFASLKDRINPETTTIRLFDDCEVTFDNYINQVKADGPIYDFILVDGADISRGRCLGVAFELIKPNGIILLHDAFREQYKEYVDQYSHVNLTQGEPPITNGFPAHQGLMAFFIPPWSYPKQ
jgi:predicted O-methyltransferase YrrM